MSAAVGSMLSAVAVRERARMILDRGLAGKLAHFSVCLDQMPAAADYVVDTIRRNYPTLLVPLHARWRHFRIGTLDRWAALESGLACDADERARIRFDLVVTSVLLDAGAGPSWRWRDPVSGQVLSRSEGLAIASLAAFEQGYFSSDPATPLRTDARGLDALTPQRLAEVFQVAPANPLVGLEGRVLLMKRLGKAISRNTEPFGCEARFGRLFDVLKERSQSTGISADQILTLLLRAFGSVWPDRLVINGIPLGDTWRHSGIDVPGPTHGLMPFHKLSQWLTYSLVEPLNEAGVLVTGLDELTGLAEYRNGGLFLDLDVIVPRARDFASRRLTPADEQIVEWRALTVALLDEIAPLVRTRLGRTAAEMPLASILEGGTWAAGRRIANERRGDGSPPLSVLSDGSVF